jgi:hypothetical protein
MPELNIMTDWVMPYFNRVDILCSDCEPQHPIRNFRF